MTELVTSDPLESAIDTPIGEHTAEPPLPAVDPSQEPLAALEQAILPALTTAPCLVAFSGGRDSSAILAVATRLARREGLALPIPLTQVLPDFPDTEESRWQELVIRHLAVQDWVRQRGGSELSMLGPIAQSLIRRHGIVAPTGLPPIVPMLSEARGGVLVTGVDGDGLFGGGRFARLRDVIAGREAPGLRDVITLGRLVAPCSVRRRWDARRSTPAVPWLREDAAQILRRRVAVETAKEPFGFGERTRSWARSRLLVQRRQALDLVAGDFNTKVLDPFLDPFFLATLAARAGAFGYGSRNETMRTLFGRLLPEPVLVRSDKADFTALWWSGEARVFVEDWNGAGAPDVVDAEGLRREWSKPLPDVRTGLLLQAVWLKSSGLTDVKQPFNCTFE